VGALDNIRGANGQGGWLSWHYWESGGGAVLWRGVCDLADETSLRLREALRTRLPSLAPQDALGEIAFNANLDPPQTMPLELLRRYLADPWRLWRKAGTRARIIEECALRGLSVDVVSWRDLANRGIPQAFGGDTSCWYLQVLAPHPWRAAIRWDGGPAWDQARVFWDASNHDPALLADLRRIIAKWKPAASSCRYIEAWTRVDLFGNPVEIVRFPVYEDWELDRNGNAKDYYNGGYL
jgi:hypothetical protein